MSNSGGPYGGPSGQPGCNPIFFGIIAAIVLITLAVVGIGALARTKPGGAVLVLLLIAGVVALVVVIVRAAIRSRR